MHVFLSPPPSLSLAMQRVAHHLAETAPAYGFEVVNKETQADFFVLHVIGADSEETIWSLRGKPYAMLQYCVRSTAHDSKWWMPLWDGAAAVWSYYDLIALLKEDNAPVDTMRNFYHAPLGGDFRSFRRWSVPKSSVILTSGYVAESEGIHEAAEAVRRIGGKMVHLGPKENFPELAEYPVAFMHRVNDGILSQAYSRSKYVAGLRRGEGFELPAVEGLLSGARPVCFDRPHYRQWFEGFAEFIPEGTKEEVTDALEALFRGPYREVTETEIAEAREKFDWERLTAGFWAKVREALPEPKAQVVVPSSAPVSPVTRVTSVTPKKRTLIWSGDAGVASGFARATHKTIDALLPHFNVEVVGINYLGEPHEYPYRIHPAISRDAPMDGFGVRKVAKLTSALRPDVVVIQNDPWNVPMYLKRLAQTPVIASMPVDGLNCKGAALNGLAHAIFWTEFGKREAQRGGYAGPSSVVPLGVDRSIYFPRSLEERMSIRRRNLPADVAEGFIIGNANRNQPRKRWDLTVRYFAEWIHRFKVTDAYLYLHVAPTGDAGYAIEQLASYYGINNRLILAEPEIGLGVSEDSLARTYAMWDAQMTTTQGEGWGLTTLEGMACGVPQILPDWSALGEWAKPYAIAVPCTSTCATPSNINVIGGVADEEIFISALERVYRDRATRESLSELALKCAAQSKFDWADIGEKFLASVEEALRRPILEGVSA